MAPEYPFQWDNVPKEELEACMPEAETGFIRSTPGNVWMPESYRDIAEKIYHFEVRPDDIWIVTYPKCGTTWTQELVWHIVNNVNIPASRAPLFARSPFLEFQAIVPERGAQMMIASAPDDKRAAVEATVRASVDYAASLPSPRIIKTHMPISMLPPALFETGCKVVYVCRNPKDTCVSYFHHTALLFPEFKETFQHFAAMFMEGKVEYGSYWFHLKDALKYRHHSNLKIVWYEEMKKDLIGIIREMSKFLGYHLTELKILTLDDHLYIGNLRKHGSEAMFGKDKEMSKTMQQFFRKGQIGDWKNYFSGEKLEEWDAWINRNLEGTNIKMVFE